MRCAQCSPRWHCCANGRIEGRNETRYSCWRCCANRRIAGRNENRMLVRALGRLAATRDDRRYDAMSSNEGIPGVFERLDLRRVINASGTETPYGAAPVRPEVIAAVAE